MSKKKIVLALSALSLAGCLTLYAPKPPVASVKCRQATHIYDAKRLTPLDADITITGTVTKVFGMDDGDTHVNVHPDKQFGHLLGWQNKLLLHNNLIVEVICSQPGKDHMRACTGYENKITLPSVGDYVRVEGCYVTDDHNLSVREIHPAYSIERVYK